MLGVKINNVLGWIGSWILGVNPHLGITCIPHLVFDRQFQYFRNACTKTSGDTQRSFVEYF